MLKSLQILQTMIQVSCAIIEKEGTILAALRSPIMDRGGQWEFPGGKVKQGETPKECIIREIEEELGIIVEPFEQLSEVVYDYGDKQICLIPFRCHWISGRIHLLEHKEVKWGSKFELKSLNWCAADAIIIKTL